MSVGAFSKKLSPACLPFPRSRLTYRAANHKYFNVAVHLPFLVLAGEIGALGLPGPSET